MCLEATVQGCCAQALSIEGTTDAMHNGGTCDGSN